MRTIEKIGRLSSLKQSVNDPIAYYTRYAKEGVPVDKKGDPVPAKYRKREPEKTTALIRSDRWDGAAHGQTRHPCRL